MQFIDIINTFFEYFYFFEIAQSIQTFRKYFYIVGLFCTRTHYFEYRIRILCIFLYMGAYFKYIFRHFSSPQIEFSTPQIKFFSEKCEQFSYRGFLVLNGPLMIHISIMHHPRISIFDPHLDMHHPRIKKWNNNI